MKIRIAALLLCAAAAAGAAEIRPVTLGVNDAFAQRLASAFNKWAAPALPLTGADGTAMAAQAAFSGSRLLNSVCFQERDGASGLSREKGSRKGQQAALVRALQLLSALQKEGGAAVYRRKFTPRRFEPADFRSLSGGGEPRLDILRFAFLDEEKGKQLEEREYLAVRFYGEGRTTLWLTGDKALIAAYTRKLGGKKTEIAAAAAAATPVPAIAETRESGSMTLTVRIREGNAVNVREKPSRGGKAVGWAMGGERYPLLSTAENGWLEIRLPDGKTGFVSPKMVK